MESRQGEMLKMISQIYRRTQIYMNERMKDVELSGALAPFVMITCENGEMVQNKFCELMDMSKGTVAKTMNKLEEHGYVKRCANAADGRSIDVYPTERAREVYPNLVQAGEDWVGVMTEGMTEIERNIFLELLKKVSGNIGRHFDAL
ncbi:MarR family winged helix-turn-helix transcriptional regulator [Emergencia timonensis]|uniref:MarR family winged helix-turn-helix transcriptional regulator n=1 Tax=Emergencia timonensis TaxID=1776384 RepID=UPI0039936BF9